MLKLDSRIVSLSTARTLDRLVRQLPRWFRFSVGVEIEGASHPIFCRLGGSDLKVLEQVFVERHYDVASLPSHPSLILDCGANIGASVVWFGERFPSARIVAVEPDPGNAWLLRRNACRFGDRIRIVQGGLWSHSTRLDLRTGYDGQAWSIRVVEDQTGPVEAFSITDLLEMEGANQIDILKMDIEKSEEIVLRSCGDWIGKIEMLLVEFHGERGLAWARRSFEGILRQSASVGQTSVFVKS